MAEAQVASAIQVEASPKERRTGPGAAARSSADVKITNAVTDLQ
jgi:hypothetical protein